MQNQNMKIKIVKHGDKWKPIVNGKALAPASVEEVLGGLEAYVFPVNEKTVEAPEEFWKAVENMPSQGGVD